jgi:hypothetical protein
VRVKRKLRMPARERGLRYPIEFVASELGVDNQTLLRRCEDAGFGTNGTGLKFSEAYDALSLKSVSEAARRRKNLAEAEASEIDTLNKKKQFVFKTDHENIVKDLAVSTRVKIESARYIPIESRRKLIKEIAEIKPSAAEASHK